MKPKASPAELARQRNQKYNQQLTDMGSLAVERVLSGQGSKKEQKNFNKIMGSLNGQAGNELSADNIKMLYHGGNASRQFITNRTIDNLVGHIKDVHQKKTPGGYNLTGQAHNDYVATLQNEAVRGGSGGALTEYGRLNSLLSQPIAERGKHMLSINTRGPEMQALNRDKSSDAFREAGADLGATLIQQLPGLMGNHADGLKAYNADMVTKLGAEMPEVFGDTDMARSFVAKGSALRGVFPAITTGLDVDKDALSCRANQMALKQANGMLNVGANQASADVMGLRDALAPAAQPGVTREDRWNQVGFDQNARVAAKPKKKWWQFWK